MTFVNEFLRGLTQEQRSGFYNFFNVGAWESEGYTTVGRGLAYAAGYLEKEECLTLNEDDKRYYYDNSKCGELPSSSDPGDPAFPGRTKHRSFPAAAPIH